MNRKTLIIFAAVWAVALGLVGFSELRAQNPPESPRQTLSKDSEKTTKGAENSSKPDQAAVAEEESDARKTEDRKVSSSPEKQGAEESGVKLKVAGEPGVEFSGRCSVDGEERRLEGRTPETYTYEPEERLECELSSRGDGALRIIFSEDGSTSSSQQTQQVGPGSSSLELTYSDEGLSLSTRSGSRSSESSGSSGNSRASNSQTSSQTSSSRTSQTGGSQVNSKNSSQTNSSVIQKSESE